MSYTGHISHRAPGCRVFLRPIEASWDDAYRVTRWRNEASARAGFFSQDVVTPDTHMEFMRRRKPHDLVWVLHDEAGESIGMLSLTVDVEAHTAEYGRLYIDKGYQGRGYAEDAEYTLLHFAFEVLRLDSLWLDALTTNTAVIALHHKTGWLDAGVDVPGNTHPRGPTLQMTFGIAA